MEAMEIRRAEYARGDVSGYFLQVSQDRKRERWIDATFSRCPLCVIHLSIIIRSWTNVSRNHLNHSSFRATLSREAGPVTLVSCPRCILGSLPTTIYRLVSLTGATE
jgi:hypothetical protein